MARKKAAPRTAAARDEKTSVPPAEGIEDGRGGEGVVSTPSTSELEVGPVARSVWATSSDEDNFRAAEEARRAMAAVHAAGATRKGPAGGSRRLVTKGIGRSGAKRHRKILQDSIQGVTKPAIRRLARRGGVKRLTGLVYPEMQGALKTFLTSVLKDVCLYVELARRRTVTVCDVVYALRRRGTILYGF